VKVSAVVISHGHRDELAESLPALLPQVDEVVVVANLPGSAPADALGARVIETMPVILVPAAATSVSALARASATAVSRARRSSGVGFATRKLMLSMVVAPAATAPSMTDPICSSRRTVMVTPFRSSYPTMRGAPSGFVS